MTGTPETPQSVAGRTGGSTEETAENLERLAKKGLLYRIREGNSVKYSAIPFIHGLLEFQAPWMSKKLVSLTGLYIREKLKDNMAGGSGGSGMRVLPVKESVDFQHQVATYDDVYEILKKEPLIAVTECSCRMQRKLFDRACDSPLEACLMVGPMAEYYIENKMGRQITLDEAMEIMEQARKAGLITQTQSVTRPFMICNCCKCCCGFLGAARRTPMLAKLVVSNHIAKIDPEKCTGCEACIGNCQVEAVAMNAENIAQINYDRCIGCGLCISACTEGALTLIPKPVEQQSVPNENLHQQMVRGGRRRLGEKFDEKQVVSYGFDK